MPSSICGVIGPFGALAALGAAPPATGGIAGPAPGAAMPAVRSGSEYRATPSPSVTPKTRRAAAPAAIVAGCRLQDRAGAASGRRGAGRGFRAPRASSACRTSAARVS